jgi:hypothetical protein
MLEVIVGLVGIIVTTMVMVAGLLSFRSWGDQQGVNALYPNEQEKRDARELAHKR